MLSAANPHRGKYCADDAGEGYRARQAREVVRSVSEKQNQNQNQNQKQKQKQKQVALGPVDRARTKKIIGSSRST